MKTGKIHIRQSTDGQYYFTLNASNGKVSTISEMYKERRKCLDAIHHKGEASITDKNTEA